MFDVEREYELLVESAYNKVTKDEFKSLCSKVKASKTKIQAYTKKKDKKSTIRECNKFIDYLKSIKHKVDSLDYTNTDLIEDVAKMLGGVLVSAVVAGVAVPVLLDVGPGNNFKGAVRRIDKKNAIKRVGKLSAFYTGVGVSGQLISNAIHKDTPLKQTFATYKNKINKSIKSNIQWANEVKDKASSW